MSTHFCECCGLPLDGGQCPLCDGDNVACVPPHECVIRMTVIADPDGCADAVDWSMADV